MRLVASPNRTIKVKYEIPFVARHLPPRCAFYHVAELVPRFRLVSKRWLENCLDVTRSGFICDG